MEQNEEGGDVIGGDMRMLRRFKGVGDTNRERERQNEATCGR